MEKSKNEILIDLGLKATQGLGVKLVIALFEFFLQSRCQIPTNFQFFKMFIDEKKRLSEARSDETPKNWKAENNLKLGVECCDKITLMKQIIEKEFVCGDAMMILFGSTIHTAKESYQIHFPAVKDDPLPSYVNEVNAIRSVIMKVFETPEIRALFGLELQLTNTFILFGRCQPIEDKSDLTELRNFKLPKSCKTLSFRFRGSSDFEIFEENFKELSLDLKETETKQLSWFISKTHVKGFNDISSISQYFVK